MPTRRRYYNNSGRNQQPRPSRQNQTAKDKSKHNPQDKSKHNPQDKSKHNPKNKPKAQNPTKREPVLRCFNDPHLNSQKRHYLLDLHHYCDNMRRAHSTPAMFSQLSHYAEDTLYRGDVKHLGDWSKISYLHQEALRAVSVVKEVEVDTWTHTVHTINATYYDLIAKAMNKVITDLQDDESSGTSMTLIHMQECRNFLTTAIKDAKKTVIQKYKSAHREKEIAKLKRIIKKIEEKLSEATEGSQEYKGREILLTVKRKKLDRLQSGKSYQAPHAGDLASQPGDLESQAGESEDEEDDDDTSQRTQENKFSVDLWGGKGQRTQARASDLSLKYK